MPKAAQPRLINGLGAPPTLAQVLLILAASSLCGKTNVMAYLLDVTREHEAEPTLCKF